MFFVSCNFKVQSFVRQKRHPGCLTPFEQKVCALVHSTGAVAISQVCATSRQKQKLKTLARLGVFNLHRLEGNYQGVPVVHNVLTPGPFPGIVPCLKRLCLTDLVIRLGYPEVLSVSDGEFIIYLDDVEYRAFVHREPEPLAPLIVSASKHLSFVLVERYYPELVELDPDSARILVDGEDAFRLPDGTPENAVYVDGPVAKPVVN